MHASTEARANGPTHQAHAVAPAHRICPELDAVAKQSSSGWETSDADVTNAHAYTVAKRSERSRRISARYSDSSKFLSRSHENDIQMILVDGNSEVKTPMAITWACEGTQAGAHDARSAPAVPSRRGRLDDSHIRFDALERASTNRPSDERRDFGVLVPVRVRRVDAPECEQSCHRTTTASESSRQTGAYGSGVKNRDGSVIPQRLTDALACTPRPHSREQVGRCIAALPCPAGAQRHDCVIDQCIALRIFREGLEPLPGGA
eukprot:21274-Chlamydomonas_euryale.AAC.6